MNVIDQATATVERALEYMTDAECERAFAALARVSVADVENARDALHTALLTDITTHPLAAADGARWVLALALAEPPAATGPETPAESLARFDAWTSRREAAGLGTVDEERDGILSRDRVSCAACLAVVPAAITTKVGDELICERCCCSCCGEFHCDRECSPRDSAEVGAFRAGAERLFGGAL